MSIPLVGLLAAGLFTLYLTLCTVTVGITVQKRRNDQHHDHIRQRVRAEMFERQEQTDSSWEEWIDSLSATEREILGSVVERYLRLVTGSQEEKLLEVADALELGSRADARLDRSAVIPRLRALATLSVLSYPVAVSRLEATCTDTQRVREAAARLLYERREEYPDAGIRGTEFLLWNGTDPLSIYGLDTLALLNSGSETPLLTLAETAADTWDQAVLVQVCRVLERTQTVDPEASFEWLLPLFSASDSTVRAAAVRALTPHGWRENLRDRTDIDALITDPDPQVRRAAYEVLAEWGDEVARDTLVRGISQETDSRCQLIALRGAAELDINPSVDDDIWPEETWTWLQAERASEREAISE